MTKYSVQTAGGLLARLAVLVSLLAAGCQPAPSPAARTAAKIITVRSAPALLSLRETFHACAAEQSEIGIVVLEAVENETPQPVDLTLRWGAGNEGISGYAAQIGDEELVVVAHPDNPAHSISLEVLRGMFQGSVRSWSGEASIPVEPWAYPAGDDALAVFEASALGGGAVSPRAAFTAPDPAAMLEAISGSPGAVGLLPKRWAGETVKILAVEGLPPETMRQPILALAESEPTGPEKSWLLCLQDHLQ